MRRRRPVIVALGIGLLLNATSATAGEPGPGGPAVTRGETGSHRLPAPTPSAPDALSRALATGQISVARYALERADSLFHLAAVRSRFGHVADPDPRSATLILRDLALRRGQLRGQDRRRAAAILARPTGGPGEPFRYEVPEQTPVCSAHVCVHRVASGPHAATGAWATTTLGVLDDVWSFEVDGYGYRPPKSDVGSADNGGNAKLDIYLADVHLAGLFGYCTTDDPNAQDGSGYPFFDFSAFCVLDNDYVGFGYPDPMDPLKVTAAHEFFHTVQFAYDAAEDGFLIEGTATWIEDEVYDDINDNLAYLGSGPLAQPSVPLDRSTSPRVYGTWIFWRFLSEYVGRHDGVGGRAPDPTIIRSIWQKADADANGPDRSSIDATARSIAQRTLFGRTGRFRWAFADFAVWNARPAAFYDEGSSYDPAAVAGSRTLRGSRRSTSVSAKLDHLANRTVAIRRGTGLPAGAELRVSLDGPAYRTGTEGSLVAVARSGAVSVATFRISRSGDAVKTVAFGSRVSRVLVIVTNGSTRYASCFDGTVYACRGTPVDDDRPFTFRASVV